MSQPEPPTDEPPPVYICRSRAEITRAMAALRRHRGLSQQALDDVAGWADGYTGKLEAFGAAAGPSGRIGVRCAFHPALDEWLQSLRARIVVVPKEEGMDVVSRAVPVPPKKFKLTRRMVPRILALWETGRYNRLRLAERFGAPLSIICDVVEGRGGRHLSQVGPLARTERNAGAQCKKENSL